MDFLRPVIDCLLTAWFIVGNMWFLGGLPPISCSYFCRTVVVMMLLGLVSCVVPVVVGVALCFCMPPAIRALHFYEEDDDDDETSHGELGRRHEYLHYKLQGRSGASEAAIEALPLLTFVPCALPVSSPSFEDSIATHGAIISCNDTSTSCNSEVISCCICLEIYEEGVCVRELPCTHRFHMACVDRWLRANATCPLCKRDIDQFAPEELVF